MSIHVNFMSIHLNSSQLLVNEQELCQSCQFMSFYVNLCNLKLTNIFLCQSCQFLSIHVNPCQFIPIHVNLYQIHFTQIQYTDHYILFLIYIFVIFSNIKQSVFYSYIFICPYSNKYIQIHLIHSMRHTTKCPQTNRFEFDSNLCAILYSNQSRQCKCDVSNTFLME